MQLSHKANPVPELWQSDTMFKAAFNISPDLMSITKVDDGLILEVNDGYSKMLGYTRDESVGRTTSELVVWHNPADRQKFVSELKKHGQIINFDVTLQRKDGSLVDVIISARTFKVGDEAYILSVAHDITERKKAEEQLQISEEKFKSFFHKAAEVMLVIGAKGDILEVNDPAIERYGYSRAEFLKMNVRDLDAPETPSESEKNFRETEKKGYILFERLHRKKNGDKVPVAVSSSPLEYNGQKAVLAIVRDISERKRMEEELKASETKYATLVESGNDGILILQDKGILKYVNAIMREVTGYAQKDVIGKSFLEFVLPKYQKIEAERFQKRLAGQNVSNRYEIEILSKGGKITPVEINASKIEYEGRPAIMAIVRDMTERKKAEELVNEVKNRDEAVLSSIGDAVFACDTKGMVVLFNEMAEKMTGVSAQEAVGKHYGQIVTFIRESDEKPGEDFVARAIQINQITKMENHTILVAKDGRRIPVSDSAAPVKDLQGKTIGCVVVFHDMTAEREIDRARNELVSLASHQLRTPLTTLSWTTELLRSDNNDRLTQKQQKYVAEIYTATKRMIALVDALLNVSRLELGNFLIEPKTVKIKEVVDVCLKELSVPITTKKLTLTEDYDKNVTTITADPKLLGIVFNNLLSNAVKYTPKGGKIEVRVRETSDQFVITVTDDGIGIPKQQQNRVFEKLFRADNARMLDPDGTGLGLYMVKEIIEHAGGKVWFESEQDKGSTFNVMLPLSGMVKQKGTRQLV